MSRIDRITVHRIRLPLADPMHSGAGVLTDMHNVVVEVHAGDRCGIGYSYGFDEAGAAGLHAIAVELARDLIGADGLDRCARTTALRRRAEAIGTGPDVTAAAACLDLALWDVWAQLLGSPLCSLVGGPRKARTMYGSGGSFHLALDELCAEAVSFQDRGYAGYKLRVGLTDLDEDVERVLAVRAELRPDFFLAADANQGWDRRTAAAACSRLAGAGLAWLEEPLVSADVDGLVQLRRQTSIPISAGESPNGPDEVVAMIHRGAVDIVQPDVMRCGGLTRFFSVAAAAAEHRVRIMPHLFAEVSAHVLAGLPTGEHVEHLEGWFEHLFSTGPAVDFGLITPEDRPGLGLEVDGQTIAQHARARVEV